jgi:hypothetical protein
MQRAFVIRPFGKKTDSSGQEIDFDHVHEVLIGPALAACKLGGGTTGEIVESGNIREDMFSLILEADLVLCDFTVHNANVFYELGIRHALRKRRTILLRGEPTEDNVAFDLLTDRYQTYKVADPASALPALIEMIQGTLRSDRDTDSPIFQMLPKLKEADPTEVQVVPLDFLEEVERARAGWSKGWLRLLAQDIRGQRFQWPGLRLIADAQWKLQDFEGARSTFESIREARGVDDAANLTLANIYERLSRTNRSPELLVASDHAIDRVLVSTTATPKERVEALSIKSRNQKTRWRREFEDDEAPGKRRQKAMNRKLQDAYDAYREAFEYDLNHYYPGVAALQMGKLFLELSAEGEGTAWHRIFPDARRATEYRQNLSEEIEILHVMVAGSIRAELARRPEDDPERAWANVSKADLLFLFDENEDRVVSEYEYALPERHRFAWDAARGQLTLFATLGFRAELAKKVIATIDAGMPTKPAGDERPLHMVIFAGHRVDVEGSPPRFPAEKVEDARRLIREKLEALGGDQRVETLASAAPGADILFHEICGELGIASTLCLPMPMDVYSTRTFKAQHAWRNRFIDLHNRLREAKRVLELSDRPGLPGWLEGADADPWERGNRWVLQMALSAGAKQVTLITLWDGKRSGEPGGTAHMVEIAEAAGSVRFDPIDSNQLLA